MGPRAVWQRMQRACDSDQGEQHRFRVEQYRFRVEAHASAKVRTSRLARKGPRPLPTWMGQPLRRRSCGPEPPGGVAAPRRCAVARPDGPASPSDLIAAGCRAQGTSGSFTVNA